MSIADQVRELKEQLSTANATIAELRAANTPAKTPAFKVGDRVCATGTMAAGSLGTVRSINDMGAAVRFDDGTDALYVFANLRPVPAEKPAEAKVDTFLYLVLACDDAKFANAIDAHIDAKLAAMKGGVSND